MIRVSGMVVAGGLFLCAAVVCVGSEDRQGRILQFARAGQNAEAIAAFEKLPDRDQAELDVLRAVAGCYWRERRFEEARVLYRHILERQSNLTAIGNGGSGSALLAREPSIADTEASPSVGDDGQAADALAQELDALKVQYQALAEERESRRQEADARITELMTAAAERAGEMEALRTQVAGEAAKAAAAEAAVLQEREQLEARASVLNMRIETLAQEVEAANAARAAIQSETDLKINDLLDAIETEKTRKAEVDAQLQATMEALEVQKAAAAEIATDLEREVEAAWETLTQERRLAEAAAANHELREAELRVRVEQVTAASDEAQLQAISLEQTLGQLRDQLDAVTAQLAVRDLELAQEIDRVDRASLALALDEIERMEQEQAARDAAVAQQQALLLERIEVLGAQASEANAALGTVERDLEDERRQRFNLEARAQEQAKALADTGAMLEEAKAALARQYDAIREQVQGGITMRLEDGETAGTGVALNSLSPDLVPMIGQLEAATATAAAEVKQLREQLERERAMFAAAAAEKDAGLSAMRVEMAAMQQRVEAIAEGAGDREAAMATAHTAVLAAMTEAHELRVAGLKGEIDGLRNAVAARDRAVGMLEDDLQTERASTARVLAMARETEAALAARIRELETAFALPDTEAPDVTTRDRAELRDAVFDSILEMIPNDRAGAIARFEALPPTTDIPDPVLKAMGNLYREQGDYAIACKFFEKLVERNPDDLYAERKLVMTLFDMGLYDQALDRLAGPGETRQPDGN